MTQELRVSVTLKETIVDVRHVIVPSLPWLFLFAFIAGYRVWSQAALPPGGAYYVIDLALILAVIYAGCLFSAVMYRSLMSAVTAPLRRLALRLGLANLALYLATLIIVFILTLFLSIFSGVMVGLTDYDPSNADPAEVANSMTALRETGTIWPLYILLVTSIGGLVWFALRIILFGAGTAALDKVVVFQSWSWTKTHVVKLLALTVILQVLVFAVCFTIGEAVTRSLGIPSTLSVSLEGSTFSLEYSDISQLTPLQAGTGTALRILILAPFWWVGHALAVALYRCLAPSDQAMTPAASS